MSTGEREYDIRLDDKYGSLTLIDVPSEIASHEPWFNQTLTSVNEAVVRLGIIEGELLIDLEDRDTVVLGHHQGYTVPKRVLHRTRASRRTAILMVEAAGVVPTGG